MHDLKMQVRLCSQRDVAGNAHCPDRLTGDHSRAVVDSKSIQMTVSGNNLVPMIYLNEVAVTG